MDMFNKISHQYIINQMNRYQTVNSFTRTPACTQISAYLVYIGQCLTFFICMYPNFTNQTSKQIIMAFYIATAILQAAVSIVCSYIDPSDSTMIQFRNNRAKTTADLRDCLYCDICQSYVKETSRHCRQCQRCVQGFDHHCIWINNCIGSKNYRLFFIMISITLINMMVYLIGIGMLWSQNKWKLYLASMIVLWVFSVLVIIFSFLLANLILLHIYLSWKGLTTYQFIMLQRQQQKRKKLEMQKEKQKRVSQYGRDQHQITIVPVRQKQKNGQSKINTFVKEQSKSNSSHNHQNIIFGNYVGSSHNTDKESENDLSQNKESKERSNQDNDDNSISSMVASSVNLSHFFTKNKSLKFLVGDQVGQRPKTSKAVQNQQSNYNSLKMISSQKEKMKKLRQKQQLQKSKQIQYSTQNNRKKQKSQIEFGNLNQLKIFPKK